MSKIDPVEIESYVKQYANIALYIFIGIGLIVVILSPYIIDYFTK